MLNISATAEAVGLSVKTVRYYSDIGLVRPGSRSNKGYRLYGESEIKKLILVARARKFSFSIDECRDLLSLYENKNRSNAEVKNITLRKISEIEERMRELTMLHKELASLAKACKGDERPDCPILSSLAQN